MHSRRWHQRGYPCQMFGLTFEKMALIGIIAVFLLGPDKLPHYAAQLGRLVRRMKEMANGASDRLREEMGPDFDEVDWKKYDPRKYDPRTIIRTALLDEDPPVVITPPVSKAPEEKPLEPDVRG